MAAIRVPVSGFTTTAPRTSPVSQPARGGPQREVRLLAVGEVPLVEQAHLLEELPAGEHQRAVRVPGRLPPLRHRRRGQDPPEVRVDHRRQPVAEVGAGQTRRGGGRRRRRASGRGTRLRLGVVGCQADPADVIGVRVVQHVAEARVRPGPKPTVAGKGDERHAGGEPGPHGRQRVGVRSVVDDDHAHPAGHLVVEEAGHRRHAAIGPVPVDDHDGEHGAILAHGPGPGARWGHGRRDVTGATPRGLDAARDLLAFIDASPSPFHAVATAAAAPRRRGLHRARRGRRRGRRGPGRHLLCRGGSLVAWATDERHGPTSPFRIIGAHTDSPNLRVKPHARRGPGRLPPGGGRGLRRRAPQLLARPRPRAVGPGDGPRRRRVPRRGSCASTGRCCASPSWPSTSTARSASTACGSTPSST